VFFCGNTLPEWVVPEVNFGSEISFRNSPFQKYISTKKIHPQCQNHHQIIPKIFKKPYLPHMFDKTMDDGELQNSNQQRQLQQNGGVSDTVNGGEKVY